MLALYWEQHIFLSGFIVCLHLWAAGGSYDVIENTQQELRARQNLVIIIIMIMIIITTMKIIIWKTEKNMRIPCTLPQSSNLPN